MVGVRTDRALPRCPTCPCFHCEPGAVLAVANECHSQSLASALASLVLNSRQIAGRAPHSRGLGSSERHRSPVILHSMPLATDQISDRCPSATARSSPQPDLTGSQSRNHSTSSHLVIPRSSIAITQVQQCQFPCLFYFLLSQVLTQSSLCDACPND